jgi:lipoyl(octanoyl) transferase
MTTGPTFTGPPAGRDLMVRWLADVTYDDGWALQRQVHARVVDGAPDELLLLEHEGVYTAGRRTQPSDRPLDPTTRVIDVDRGGRITWHGPGQLVGYPILRLSDPIDVVAHVRRVEQLLMLTCADLGLSTGRVEGRSGVWVGGDRKVAAIGVRVAAGVTMHGFALNADCDLRSYDAIVPCGLPDAAVTSLTAELGRHVGVNEVRTALLAHLACLTD